MSRSAQKKRRRAVAEELGIGTRGAANVIRQRAACQRAGHVWHTRIDVSVMPLAPHTERTP